MRAKSKLIGAAAVAVITVIAIVSIIFICRDNVTENMSVDMYFINADATGIVAQPKKIRYGDGNELIQNTLIKLRKGPDSMKLGEIMPRSTQIKNIELRDDRFLTVNFSENFLTNDPARNVLNTYAVVKTLCSTGQVSSVRVLVEGKAIRDREGNKLEYISASDINLETEEYQSELREVTLYFADETKKKLVRESRTIKITDQQPIEQYIINELIKGTNEKAERSVLSDKTVLVSVNVEDNICYLNFKASFLSDNSGGEDHEALVIYSIVNSLTELQTIGRVQFYMDGKRVKNFGSVNIKDYISRNTQIINEEGA